MSTTWTINGYEHSIANPDAGPFKNLRLKHQAHGVSLFEFDYLSQTALTDADIIAYGTSVTLSKDGTTWFKGKVISNPRIGTDEEETQHIVVANAVHDLTRCTYQQAWSAYSGGTKGSTDQSRVILGGIINSGQQITNVINYASNKGVNIAAGTITAELTLPSDERSNMSCWEVILSILRFLPDHVCWIDYTATIPTFNCRSAADVSARTFDLTGGNLISLTPRRDLQVPGVRLVYEQTGNVDGKDVTSVFTDTAGDTNALNTIHGSFNFQGVQRTYLRARIETSNIPDDPDVNSVSHKEYAKKLFPALQAFADSDIQITLFERTGELSKIIERGPVPDWLGETEADDQRFLISYVLREDPEDDESEIIEIIRDEEFRLRVQTTDRNSGSYRKLASFTSAEPLPFGTAQDLYEAWSVLHYEGSLTYTKEEVDGLLRPGRRLQFTSNIDPLNGNSAIIKSTREEIDRGTTTVEFGPPDNLDANTLVGLFRSLRSHRVSWSRDFQADADLDEEEEDTAEISGATPGGNRSQSAPKRERLQIVAQTTDDPPLTHKITLDPALITFAADPYNSEAGEPTAKEIQPLECFILVPNGVTGLSAQRVQLLGCQPYGTPIQILPDGLTEGDLLVMGTDNLGILSAGAENDYLKSDGTNPVWQTPSEC